MCPPPPSRTCTFTTTPFITGRMMAFDLTHDLQPFIFAAFDMQLFVASRDAAVVAARRCHMPRQRLQRPSSQTTRSRRCMRPSWASSKHIIIILTSLLPEICALLDACVSRCNAASRQPGPAAAPCCVREAGAPTATVEEHIVAHPAALEHRDKRGLVPLHLAAELHDGPQAARAVVRGSPAAAAESNEDGLLLLHIDTPKKTTSVGVIQVLSEASAMHTAARPVDLTPLLLAALPSSCNTHVSKARCIAALWICKADASTPGCAPIKPQHTCEQTQVYCSAPMTPLLLAALHYGHTGWVEQQHTREQSPGALQRALWICKADASALGCAPLRSHIVG